MSLVFTDWENCTDSGTGQVFWLNWTADTGMGLHTHLEGFRQALVDKYAMTGTTLTGLLASEIPVGSCKLKDYGAAIDTGVTTMIPKFVNHLDNGGNWQGQTTCAPLFTSATILTAIGAASRILSGDKKQITVEWMKQVYALLNMMRWTKINQGSWVHTQSTCYREDVGQSPVESLIDFAEARKVTATGIFNGISNPFSYSYARQHGGIYYLFDGGVNAQQEPFGFSGICGTLYHSGDLYAFGDLPSSGGYRRNVIWSDQGLGYLEGSYNLLETDSPVLTTSKISAVYGNVSVPVPKYPIAPYPLWPIPFSDPPYSNDWHSTCYCGWRLTNGVYVIKFDVPGGSKFF